MTSFSDGLPRQRRTLLRLLPLLLPLGFFVSSSSPAVGEGGTAGIAISEEVQAAAAAGQSPRVIIFLDLPEAAQGNPARRKEEVAQAQQRVLAALTDKEFVTRWRFETVPALAGEITAPGLAKLAGLPGVLRVDLDTPSEAHLLESVPLIQASQVQSLGHRGQGVSVAILDSGIDISNPELSDDLIAQECFCSGGCCPNGTSRQSGPGAAGDSNGHGTNVTGIVTAKGVTTPIGVAPDADIVAIRVLDANGQSCCTSDIVAGLDWVAANRPDVRVVNMSLGSFTLFSGNCDASFPAYANVINNLRSNGVITFASAGNQASGTQMAAPACIANTVSVGATYDANIGPVGYSACTDSTTFVNKVTCFSNSNATTDIFAPGAAIQSTGLFGSTSTYYGTSQASPHAAGCAADFLSANSALTPAQIETALKTSGVQVTDPKNNRTFPRINCLAALASLGACIDLDGDGYGQPGSPECPNGAAADCDDARATVYPGAAQICDGRNNNCSAPGWPAVPANEVDADADDHPLCGDCSDNQATVYPGAPQLCDGINNDCNAPGWPAVTGEQDGDGDGRRVCNDCNDANPAIYPGAPQPCDGINNDCNTASWPALTGTNEADDDGDTLSECQGDCLDTNAATYPGASQICDGSNNNCSIAGWPSILGTNEFDDDQDAWTECAGDCNDASAAVRPGGAQACDGVNNDCSAPGWPGLAGTNEGDDDLDGFAECAGDCNDASAAVSPGHSQVCDGINNNCLAPGWPALTGTNETDDDGDSQSECQSDCNDADSATFSGALEVNDGKDNQCPSNPGYGIQDEISGVLGFTNPLNRNEVSWPPQSAATSYEVTRSGSPFQSASPFLQTALTSSPLWSDSGVPPVGAAFFYLARPITPHLGSWGQLSSGLERPGLANPETSCNDSTDNDGDALTDCADPDCFASASCAVAVFTFTDTMGDDIASGSLTTFFSSLSVAPTDYLFFSLTGPGVTDFSICAEHADFYKSQYLSLAVVGGSASSGSWNRWTLEEGGGWSAPDTVSRTNNFGTACLEDHSWCPEAGLAGRDLAVNPEQTTECETFDFAIGCSPGSWQLTIKIGHTRAGTCGF
jgi:subtilase family protein/putative metal-binding protein